MARYARRRCWRERWLIRWSSRRIDPHPAPLPKRERGVWIKMKTKIWIALLALYIVWGSTYLAIRFAVETIPPFFQAGLRFFISGIIVLIWRRLSGEPFPTSRQWRNTAVIGLLLLQGGKLLSVC